MTIKEISTKYNISEATIRNWYKLNYIKDISNIETYEIENIKNSKKKSRLNKKDSLEQSIPKSYLNSEESIQTIQKLLNLQNTYSISLQTLLYFTIKKILKNKFTNEIDNELKNTLKNITPLSRKAEVAFNNISLNFSKNDDFIGGLYMSLMSVGSRSKSGIYYTPSNVVDLAIKKIDYNNLTKIYDPSCGSGNFLINIFNKLSTKFSESEIISNLYGSDIDSIAVLLCKINLYYLTKNIKFDEIHISKIDFLQNIPKKKFDVIIGNPPWGAKFSKSYLKDLSNIYNFEIKKYDSFALFIHNSLSILKEKGNLIFILPSSIANIEKHEEIRKEILNYSPEISFLGRDFSEVYTDIILLKITKTNSSTVALNNRTLSKKILLHNPYTSFLAPSNEFSASILNKVNNFKSFYLKDNIIYALGIVTGNNEKFLKSTKLDNYEPVLTGKNLKKFYIDTISINKFILFDSSNLQQVAPENLYRSKNKILYKFIGNKLVFAYDNRGLISLNSANLIILPEKLDGYYISAILNSRVTQLYFNEYYNTHKVLKNHIQNFPIFEFDDLTKQKISKLSKQIISKDTFEQYFEDIENLIYKNLYLSNEEIKYLKKKE